MSFTDYAGAAQVGMNAFQMGYGMWQNNLQRKDQWRMFNIMQEREDTAVQRRRRDLEAAGLHPTLAAGQGAAAGPGTVSPGNKIEKDMQLMNIAMMREELKNIRAQRNKTYQEISNMQVARDTMMFGHHGLINEGRLAEYRADAQQSENQIYTLYDQTTGENYISNKFYNHQSERFLNAHRVAQAAVETHWQTEYGIDQRKLEMALQQVDLDQLAYEYEYLKTNRHYIPSGRLTEINHFFGRLGVDTAFKSGLFTDILDSVTGAYSRTRPRKVAPSQGQKRR